jgi:hypothetical protein
MPRHEDYDPDGTGARPHPVHDMPPVLVRQDTTANRYAVPEYHDYWQGPDAWHSGWRTAKGVIMLLFIGLVIVFFLILEG